MPNSASAYSAARRARRRGGVRRVVRAGEETAEGAASHSRPPPEPPPARGDVAPPPSRSCDASRARRVPRVARDATLCRARSRVQRRTPQKGNAATVDSRFDRLRRASPREFRGEGADTGVRANWSSSCRRRRERRRYHLGVSPGSAEGALAQPKPLRSRTRTASFCRTRCGRRQALDQIVSGEMTAVDPAIAAISAGCPSGAIRLAGTGQAAGTTTGGRARRRRGKRGKGSDAGAARRCERQRQARAGEGDALLQHQQPTPVGASR